MPTAVESCSLIEGASASSFTSIAENSDGKLVVAVDNDGKQVAVGLIFEGDFNDKGKQEMPMQESLEVDQPDKLDNIDSFTGVVASFEECQDDEKSIDDEEKYFEECKDEVFIPKPSHEKREKSKYIKIYKSKRSKLRDTRRTLVNLKEDTGKNNTAKRVQAEKRVSKRSSRPKKLSTKAYVGKQRSKKCALEKKKFQKKFVGDEQCKKVKRVVKKVKSKVSKKANEVNTISKKRKRKHRICPQDRAFPMPASLRRKYFEGA